MSSQNIDDNGVNESGAISEGLSPGRCPVEQQRRPGRYPATVGVTRRKWTQRENEKVMECYLRSQPEKIGTLWGCAKNSGACEILGQELAC